MSRTTVDPYATLGIPRTASEQQARRAYRRLAKRHHPDVQRGAQTAEPMRRLNEAWEILSDPARRARYDAESARGTPSFGHWSAPAGRSAPTSGSPHWNRAWASPPPAGVYRPASSLPDDDGPRWATVVAISLVGLVIFVALVGRILPVPLFGIVVLLFASRLFGRVD